MKKKVKLKYWRKFGLEFLSIFIAVISAFSLNNWNENKRNDKTEQKILVEIKNGLEKDLEDLNTNTNGHKRGIKACQFWRKLLMNDDVLVDSLQLRFIELTRDFTSLQNRSGYETLKSNGLELIENDSLRFELISLYEYDYYTLRKLEEEYEEMQYQKNYFKEINYAFASNFIFDKKGNLIGINRPAKQKIRLYGPDRYIISSDRDLVLHFLKARNGDTRMSFFKAVFEEMRIEEMSTPQQDVR